MLRRPQFEIRITHDLGEEQRSHLLAMTGRRREGTMDDLAQLRAVTDAAALRSLGMAIGRLHLAPLGRWDGDGAWLTTIIHASPRRRAAALTHEQLSSAVRRAFADALAVGVTRVR